jgi:hypothetical protein
VFVFIHLCVCLIMKPIHKVHSIFPSLSSSLSFLLFYEIDMNVEAGPVGVSAASGMLF